MSLGQAFDAFCRRSGIRRLAMLCLVSTALAFPFLTASSSRSSLGKPSDKTLDKTGDAPQPIYSQNPDDPWNRIFYHLFTRRIEVHVSSEYPEGAPFTEFRKGSTRLISTRTFERLEIGDRAIDPLYPNFFNDTGARRFLTDSSYSLLVKALQEAVSESGTRSPVARALMQSDLWSAYDQLSGEYTSSDQSELEQHRRVIADLLGHLIKKIALTPEEIRSLPDNYSAAAGRQSLPDLFAKESGWIEILWFPHRMHEEAANDRRVARVFLKPTHPTRDLQKFVNEQREENGDPVRDLDGVALIMQLLLIDTQGKLTPTTLTMDVQVRFFEKSAAGSFKAAKVQMAEISRRLFVSDPASGGLAPETEDSPAYMPVAGNDYSFASPQVIVEGPPIQVHLRTRCAFCHGDDLTEVMTFSIALPARFLTPPLRQLDPAANREADDVVSRKRKRREFKALQAYFETPGWHWPFGFFFL
jgi:hypothetical protein